MEEHFAAMERYQSWLNDPHIDKGTKRELVSLAHNTAEITDRFYRDLEFGTGGLRGIMGAGTNRINAYTVGRATQGLANWLRGKELQPSIVIAHDSRINSSELSLVAAEVMAANGIVTYIWRSLRPTPQLSFMVRHLQGSAGIVITASHNPPEYNGYKVYDADGCQLLPEEAKQVMLQIQQVRGPAEVKRIKLAEAEAAGLLRWLDASEDQAYYDAVTASCLNENAPTDSDLSLKIIYTPLHGAGNLPVRHVLQRAGFSNVLIVPEQEHPDGSFPTVQSPNPEEKESFALANKLAKEVHADLVIGTDPDCDRLGAVVKNNEGDYVVLTGNQIGALLVYYLLSQLKDQGKLPANGAIIKTIVTNELGAVIAASFGVDVVNTLTGFKYIGEQITRFERSGERTFLFGYEESFGFLAGTYARDKDAVIASLLICEAAAYYKRLGIELYQLLLQLYEEYGTYLEGLESRTYKGLKGEERISAIMGEWRLHPPAEVAGVPVVTVLDYVNGLDGLRAENVLKYVLADGSWFCLRPSGTEPKIKVYFSVRGQSQDDASRLLSQMVKNVMARVDNMQI